MRQICKYAVFVSVLLAAVSCGKDKVEYDMTDAGRAAMDRLVGVYEIAGAEWDGVPVDLDGDGAASPIYDELVKVSAMENAEIEISMTAPYNTRTDIILPMEEIRYGDVSWREYGVPAAFKVTSGGEYELGIDENVGFISDETWNRAYFYKMKVTVAGDDEIDIKGYTFLYDARSREIVNGWLTYRFKCISGKGRTR